MVALTITLSTLVLCLCNQGPYYGVCHAHFLRYQVTHSSSRLTRILTVDRPEMNPSGHLPELSQILRLVSNHGVFGSFG